MHARKVQHGGMDHFSWVMTMSRENDDTCQQYDQRGTVSDYSDNRGGVNT